METEVYRYAGCQVAVLFENRSVHITNDKELWALLSEDMESRIPVFAAWIRAQYERLQGRKLDITADSLVMEICGHVYFDYYVQVIKEVVPIELFGDLLDRVNKASEIIDCGEAELDNNRRLWDALAPHKDFILKMLPGKIDPDKLPPAENAKR